MSDDPFFYFDPTSLHTRAEALAESYRTASPFPHAVIDNLLPDAIALRLAREFPAHAILLAFNAATIHTKC
jgi:hypothetical protein